MPFFFSRTRCSLAGTCQGFDQPRVEFVTMKRLTSVLISKPECSITAAKILRQTLGPARAAPANSRASRQDLHPGTT